MPIHTLPTAVTARRGLHDVEYDPPRILQSPYSALSPYGSWVTGSARIGAPSANVGAAAVGPAGKLSRTFSAIAGTSSRRGSSASGSGSAAATAATAGSASSASSSSLSRPWLRQPKTDERVRFAWSNEPDVMPRLRRFAQLVAIDTMGEKEGARTSKARFSAITGVLAWWEDEEGYWLVYTSDREDVEPLPVYWTEMYEGKGKGKGKEREGAGGGYCTECFCLLSVAEVMRALHRKGLALLSTKPSTFGIRDGQAVLLRFDDVALLPNFAPPAIGTLFSKDTLEGPHIDDAYIRSNLRYLSPITADVRRVGQVGDIYSFGVLAFELITGSTIDGGPESPGDADIDLLADIHRHMTCDILPPFTYLEREAKLGGVDRHLPPKELSDVIMKCLARDLDERYGSLDALAYDLRRLGQICKSGGDFAKFTVGQIDHMSRFSLPAKPVHREDEMSVLRSAWQQIDRTLRKDAPEHVSGTSTVRVINVWGLSGSGKTRLVQTWAKELEGVRHGLGCLIAQSKLDEYSSRPISSFVQVFQSLLDRVLTDPKEDAKAWSKRIRVALGQQFPIFHSLLSHEYQRLLMMGEPPPTVEQIDWANFIPAFKGWAKRLIQIFAIESRPLVCVIDDLQWMRQDEVSIWRALLEGSHPINHVLLVSLYRTEGSIAPPMSDLLSAHSTTLHIERLPETGVSDFIQSCLPTTVDGLGILASFLFEETQGSPLYLRSLMVSLVRDGVIYFDFDVLFWRFDPLALPAHLSDNGVDAYLEKMQQKLPAATRDALQLLACLPVSGCRLELLAELTKCSEEAVVSRLSPAQGIGAIIIGGNHVRFAHDRPRSTAYRSIPRQDLGHKHLRVSEFLRQTERSDDYIFEAANHAIIAKDMGVSLNDKGHACELFLYAADRAAMSASFELAKKYLETAEEFLEKTKGQSIKFLSQLAQVGAVLGLHDDVYSKLNAAKTDSSSELESIQIDCLYMRQLIAANRHPEAMKLLWHVCREYGYDPLDPNVVISLPQTPEEVDAIQVPQDVSQADGEDRDVRDVIMAMLSYAGATIFVSEVEYRIAAFRVGASLAIAAGLRHHAAAYLMSTYAITHDQISMQEALYRLTLKLCNLRPSSWLTGSALVVAGALAHHWTPLDQVAETMTPAFDLTLNLGNYELTAYVFSLDCASRRFSKRLHDINFVMDRYRALRTYTTPGVKVLIHAPLQYALKLIETPSVPTEEPWSFEGKLLSRGDVEAVKALDMHVGLSNTFALRLMVMFDAPLQTQLEMIDHGWEAAKSLANTVFGSEWAFLAALAFVRNGGDARYDILRGYLEYCSVKSRDMQLRIRLIDHVRAVISDSFTALAAADDFIDELEAEDQWGLSGMLHRIIASILSVKGPSKLCAGYLIAACEAFKNAEAFAVCHDMYKLYPKIISPGPYSNRLLGEAEITMLADLPTPNMPLAKLSVSEDAAPGSAEVSSLHSRREERTEASDESLDTLTLMRSSLVLASEKDPQILLCVLLKLLCQFSRADYAAIALSDDDDRQMLRLRACGRSGRIIPCDTSLNDQEGIDICPTSYMLHTGRTGKSMSTPDVERARPDPFYGSKAPRNLLCLPIMNQGQQAGVILLSSQAASNSMESANTREVVWTLATFAMIVTSNYSFTHRLKLEVDQRTKELTNALAHKTQFLSQVSHELRSPLSAVLGLSAVLEASPGLSTVQREHLRTIISSGEDLLGLINNVLDFAKLESHSVELERIPFNLRDVTEGALDIIASIAQKKGIEVCLISAFAKDPPALLGDPFRIKQILMNYLSNATKFVKEDSKGRVTVEWEYEVFEDQKVKCTLHVNDNGIGIPSAKMEKLFKSFSQVDESITRSYGGSGLGLVISKNLAQLLGGDCYASSEYGKGSTFSFSFICEKDEDIKEDLRRFPKPHDIKLIVRSCFVICQLGPWWDMLRQNLEYLNCQPVRFAEDVDKCFQQDFPDGLNSQKSFHYIFLDTQIIDTKMLARMKELQPEAKMIYLVRSIDLANDMKQFDIKRESIVARPIKFSSLYTALMNSEDGGDAPKLTKQGQKKKVNKELAKTMPMKLLIVDDNKVNVLVGTKILGMFGYDNIASAADGQQAVEAAEADAYDLILLDLQMPVLDGYRALERITSSPLAGNPCVVALTANADMETQKRCHEAGFFDYLSKPLDIPKLETILSKVYEYRQKHRIAEHDKQRTEGKAHETAPILKKGPNANDDGLGGERRLEEDKAQDRRDEAGQDKAEQDRRDDRNEQRGREPSDDRAPGGRKGDELENGDGEESGNEAGQGQDPDGDDGRHGGNDTRRDGRDGRPKSKETPSAWHVRQLDSINRDLVNGKKHEEVAEEQR